MRSPRCGFWAAMLSLFFACPQPTKAAQAAADGDVRLMSFNIRYGTAPDGLNHWDRRKDFLVDTIRAFAPDLLGTQETLGFQRDFLAKQLAEFDQLGVGRDDGREAGEMMALFYRRDRFEKLEGGHFWLSETPDTIGSKSWDSSLPRMVTWVRLCDRKRPDATPLVFFNTHFDHRSPTARLESARLLRRRIASLAKDGPFLLTGDFNTGEASPPYLALFGGERDQPSPIIDSFRATHPDRAANSEGTFSSFQADALSGPRIDWIGVSRDWEVVSSAIDRTARDGRTPSDHFPVTTIVRPRSPGAASSGSGARPTVASSPEGLLFGAGGPFEVESHLDIPYREDADADARKHKLDLFMPKGIKEVPLLFFIHGGGWTTGDRKLYAPLGRVFARNGIGTVITSYRLSPGVRHPAHIEDVASAFAWTYKHIAQYGGRADRIFVTGQSAGGHLAALLATNETYLKAQGLSLKAIRGAIPISGIYNFRPGRMVRVIGEGQEAADSASPMKHVSGSEPPFLILYAENDFGGCGEMSRELCDALKEKQVQAAWKEIKDRNHISIVFRMMMSDADSTAQELIKFVAQRSELELKPRTLPKETADTLVYCSAAKDRALVVSRLDPRTGSLSKVDRLETPGEPGALAASPDGAYLFAALRSTGMLASFRIDQGNGKLTAINVVQAGADPAQISVDRTGRYLFTAYYVAGKVSVHRIAPNGSLSDRPEQELKTAEKAHAIVPDSTNRFVFVPHTGPNTIFQFAWDEQTGRLTPHPRQPRLARPEHTGPRHLAWHPSKPIAYIDNEQSSSVTAYRLGDDGSLTPGPTATTLPSDFHGDNSTAEIKVHPSGRFLYVSNRGHDSLAVLRIDESGDELRFVAAEPTETTPRSFEIDPSGRFVLSAGESSGRLAISRIDPDTGRLTLTHNEQIGPMLLWVQMLRRNETGVQPR